MSFGGKVHVLQKGILSISNKLVPPSNWHGDTLDSLVYNNVAVAGDEYQTARIWGQLTYKGKARVCLIYTVLQN